MIVKYKVVLKIKYKFNCKERVMINKLNLYCIFIMEF